MAFVATGWGRSLRRTSGKCHAPRWVAAAAGPDGGWQGPTVGGSGSGHMEKIEFIIRPDGRVEQKVIGVKGARCQEITREIEEALGEVVHTEKTTEFFEVPVNQTVEEQVKDELPRW